MKKLFLVLLILLIPSLVAANDIATIMGKDPADCATIAGKTTTAIATIMGGGVAAAPAGCSTPTGGVVNEGFEGTGYETADWTEEGSLDADAACPSGAPSGSCSQCLKWTSAGTDVYTYHAMGGQSAIGLQFFLYVDSLTAWNTAQIMQAGAWASETFRLYVADSGDGPVLNFDIYGETPVTWQLAVDTWYTIDCKITQNATSYCKVDGTDEQSITAYDQVMNTMYVGSISLTGAAVIYVDALRWKNTAAYF